MWHNPTLSARARNKHTSYGRGLSPGTCEMSLGTKTTPFGSIYAYKLGELVDSHRASCTKYVSGWKRPAKIIDSTNITRGILTVRYQRDRPIEVRLPDVRRHLEFF